MVEAQIVEWYRRHWDDDTKRGIYMNRLTILFETKWLLSSLSLIEW